MAAYYMQCIVTKLFIESFPLVFHNETVVLLSTQIYVEERLLGRTETHVGRL